MKVTTLKKTVLLTMALLGMGLAQTTHAAEHATNFLDTLQAEVATRLDNLPEEAPAEERRALTKANAALNKNTRTLGADLKALAIAGTALNAGLPDDATLNQLQDDAVDAYVGEAQAQVNAILGRLGTNEAPQALANQLSKIEALLARASDDTNSISLRAKTAAQALNKIRVANTLATRLFKAPVSLEGETVFTSRQSSPITLNSDGTYFIGDDPTAPEETGNWEFGRTSPNTGTVTLSGGGGHTLDLKFVKANGGTYSDGTIRGKFVVNNVL